VHDTHHGFLSAAHFLCSFALEALRPEWYALDLGEFLEINANRTSKRRHLFWLVFKAMTWTLLNVSFCGGLLTPCSNYWHFFSRGTRSVGSGTGIDWMSCSRTFYRRRAIYLCRPGDELLYFIGLYRGHVYVVAPDFFLFFVGTQPWLNVGALFIKWGEILFQGETANKWSRSKQIKAWSGWDCNKTSIYISFCYLFKRKF
jgi:hypothetical protein